MFVNLRLISIKPKRHQWKWGLSSVCSLVHTTCPPDLISQLLDPVVDPWLDRETCYNLITIPESYTGPRLSFPLSVSDTNALLSAFKEQQVPNVCVCSFSLLLMIFWIWFCAFIFLPHRLYMPDMFCSFCMKPKSSSNRCPISSTCQHLTPKRSLSVVGDYDFCMTC